MTQRNAAALNAEPQPQPSDRRALRRLDYSLHRHFVDQFHFRNVPLLKAGALVLDVGGNRTSKRGLFDVEAYGLRVVYANLSLAKKPHVQAEAAFLPFVEKCFDAVICSEVLEHVPDPRLVLAEVHRVLKCGGTLLMCVPFLNRIHGDPHDYGRYTDFFWSGVLHEIGFHRIHIEKQGLFWSVLVDMVRDVAYSESMHGRPRPRWLRRAVSLLIGVFKEKALQWDERANSGGNHLKEAFTTGFGVTAVKT